MTQANNSQELARIVGEHGAAILRSKAQTDKISSADNAAIQALLTWHARHTQASDLPQLSESQANHGFNSELAQDTQTLIREARLEEVERIPDAGVIGMDGIRFNPNERYKADRLAQLREGDKNDEAQ